jgi:hypothetical protein
MRLLLPTLLLFAAAVVPAAERVLIVADEIPAMEALARQFQAKAGAETKIVTQADLPPSLEPYSAVLVYIHRELFEPTEKAVLDFLKGGRKVILIHHSISSGKRKNKEWFPAFSIVLPTEKFDEGGYGYYAPATFEMVNLAPGHPVTTKKVKYERKTDFDGEIFLNHRLQGQRTSLLGIKWTDPRSGRTYQQPTGGWHMQVGKGSLFYFMAGHKVEDFSVEPYAQILANALTYRGK